MFTTNHGHAPGATTPIEKGQGSPSTLTPKTDTYRADFRSQGPIHKTHDVNTFTSRLKTVYPGIKDAVSGFYIQCGVGIEAIATLIIVVALVTVSVFQ